MMEYKMLSGFALEQWISFILTCELGSRTQELQGCNQDSKGIQVTNSFCHSIPFHISALFSLFVLGFVLVFPWWLFLISPNEKKPNKPAKTSQLIYWVDITLLEMTVWTLSSSKVRLTWIFLSGATPRWCQWLQSTGKSQLGDWLLITSDEW